jgi:hypothetical protein
VGNTPPFFIASSLKSEGCVRKASPTGPSPWPLLPWHDAQVESYFALPTSSPCVNPKVVSELRKPAASRNVTRCFTCALIEYPLAMGGDARKAVGIRCDFQQLEAIASGCEVNWHGLHLMTVGRHMMSDAIQRPGERETIPRCRYASDRAAPGSKASCQSARGRPTAPAGRRIGSRARTRSRRP